MDVKGSITKSLDGQSEDLFEYFPYLLQDLWEIGSSAKKIVKIIEKNDLHTLFTPMKVLDIGCGKGAVSISIAKEFNAVVTGIDAMPAFINEAKNKALEMKANTLCSFHVGDVRDVLRQFKEYDLAIMGSVGPILGNVEETLTKLRGCINDNGYVILDDGYISETNNDEDLPYLSEEEFFKQVEKSGFIVIDKCIHSSDDAIEIDDETYKCIETRANELINMYPGKTDLFEGYLKQQRIENEVIESKLTNVALLLLKV